MKLLVESKRWRLVIVIICLLTNPIQPLIDTGTLGQLCTRDEECSPPYVVCSSGKCAHKPLFPMTGQEISALILLTIFMMIALSVGIGGGVMMSPVTMYLMGFSARQATAMSNTIILMTSVCKYFLGINTKDPIVPDRTIINYNAAILIVPAMSMFSAIGGIVITYLSDGTIIVLLLIILSNSIHTGVSNYLLHKEVKSEDDAPKENLAEKLNPERELQALNDPIEAENAKAREAQKLREGQNFDPTKIWIIGSAGIISILVSLMRGGAGFPSIIGIAPCSSPDLFLILVYFGIMGWLEYSAVRTIEEEQSHKAKIGWVKQPGEVQFTSFELIMIILYCSFVGLASGCLGIAGGVLLNYPLKKMHYMPVTITWTVNLTTALGKFAVVATNLMLGDTLISYVLFYGGIITVGMMVSENVLLSYVKRTKSQLYYPVVFVFVVIVSFLIAIVASYDRWKVANHRGVSMWKFGHYCPS